MELCAFCEKSIKKEENIFESENFLVRPSLGQIVEGYLLICTKRHYHGLGHIPTKLFRELENVKEKVKKLLSDNYTLPIFFEHGPSKSKNMHCCVDHAHLHAVPVDIDLFEDIAKNFNPRKIYAFTELIKCVKKDIPYFYYENQKGEKYLFELHEIVPSQYLRKVLAVKLNLSYKWDWRTYPEYDKFNNALKKLKKAL